MKKIFKFSILALALLCVLSVGVKEVKAEEYTINLIDGLHQSGGANTTLTKNSLSNQNEFDILNSSENLATRDKHQLSVTTPNRDLLERYSLTVLNSNVMAWNSEWRLYQNEVLNLELVDGYFIKSLVMTASNSTGTFTPIADGTALTDHRHSGVANVTFSTEPAGSERLLPADVDGFTLLIAGSIRITKFEMVVYSLGAPTPESSFARLDTLSSMRFGYTEEVSEGTKVTGSTSMDITKSSPLSNNLYFDESVLEISVAQNSATSPVAISSSQLRLYGGAGNNGCHLELTAEDGIVFTGLTISAIIQTNAYISVYDFEDELHRGKDNPLELTGLATDYLKIKNTAPSNASNSQVQITAITVTYEMGGGASYDVIEGTPAVRFGVLVPVDLYNELVALPEGITFGVDVEGTFIECTTAPVRVDAAGVADPAGDYYQFSLVLTAIPLDELNVALACSAAIEVDGVITKAKVATHSFVSIAQAYLDTKADDPAVIPHLGVLRHIVRTYA